MPGSGSAKTIVIPNPYDNTYHSIDQAFAQLGQVLPEGHFFGDICHNLPVQVKI